MLQKGCAFGSNEKSELCSLRTFVQDEGITVMNVSKMFLIITFSQNGLIWIVYLPSRNGI